MITSGVTTTPQRKPIVLQFLDKLVEERIGPGVNVWISGAGITDGTYIAVPPSGTGDVVGSMRIAVDMLKEMRIAGGVPLHPEPTIKSYPCKHNPAHQHVEGDFCQEYIDSLLKKNLRIAAMQRLGLRSGVWMKWALDEKWANTDWD